MNELHQNCVRAKFERRLTSRFNTVADIIKEAKANPGKLGYCSSGNGASQHIIGEMFKRRADVDILHVPYRGTAPALTDLIANVLRYDVRRDGNVCPADRRQEAEGDSPDSQ